MKNLILFMCLLFTMTSSLYAQDFNLEIPKTYITLEVEGDVKIKKGDIMLTNGMVLSEKDVLILGEGASTTLAVGGELMTLNEAGSFKLKKAMRQMTPKGGDSFLAMINSVSGHNKKGKTDTSTQDGWGNKSKVKIIMPKDGQVPMDASTTFSWDGKSNGGFNVTLMDADGQSIFSAQTKNNSFSLDTRQLNIEKGKAYHWMVVSSESKSKKSDINFVAPEDVESVIAGVKASDEYKSSPDWLQSLRLAHALDGNKMVSKSYAQYLSALEQFPNNEIVKDAASKFFSSHGLKGMWRLMNK